MTTNAIVAAPATLALRQEIWIRPVKEGDSVLGNEPGQSIMARVVSSENPATYRIDSPDLPSSAKHHVLSWTKDGWRYWQYNDTTNPTCLVTVEVGTAAPQYPPMAGDSGRD